MDKTKRITANSNILYRDGRDNESKRVKRQHNRDINTDHRFRRRNSYHRKRQEVPGRNYRKNPINHQPRQNQIYETKEGIHTYSQKNQKFA